MFFVNEQIEQIMFIFKIINCDFYHDIDMDKEELISKIEIIKKEINQLIEKIQNN